MKDINCFIIDDDEDDRDFFEIALENLGITCCMTAAKNGRDGLTILSSGHNIPDYIFLDLNMPMVSGMECLKSIRKMPTLRKTPVVIFSTSSYYKDIEDAKELGATYFLSKTPDIDKLSSILKDIFSGKELPFRLN